MKKSLVITVLNEEKTIDNLFRSILSQTEFADEVIIVDGGSSDMTVAEIKKLRIKYKKFSSRFKVLIKKGNRAVGRNFGINRSKGDIILITDAGCELERKWIENITQPFKTSNVDVVAGYYAGEPKTIFEKCLMPYVLVMPDKVDPNNFLPATRSMAFRKNIWRKIGGFDKRFSHNEDFVFAKKLKKNKTKIVFKKNAIVYWSPRKNLLQAFVMFFRFALGDSESGIFRLKVGLIFLRYLIGAFLLFQNRLLFILLLLLYMVWSIVKNYTYIKDVRAIFYLPIIQILSDIAVLTGTISGILKRTWVIRKIL